MPRKTVAVIPDALRAKAEALNRAEVLRLSFDPKAAKRGILRALEWVAPHRAVIEKNYAGFDLPGLEVLPELCDRVAAAQREHEKHSLMRDGSSAELIREAMSWRRKLMPLAMTLAANQKVSAEAVAQIRSGRGVHDNVGDVVALAELLAPFSDLVTAACGSGALAEAKGVASLTLVRLGKSTRDTQAMRAAGELRDRLGTLVTQGHERLRLLIAALSSMREAERTLAPLRPASRKPKTLVSVDDVVS